MKRLRNYAVAAFIDSLCLPRTIREMWHERRKR